MAGRAAKSPRPIGRLLIATDFTPGATLALARAARLPLASTPRVTLLHVMPKLGPALRAAEQAEAKRRLEHDARALRKAFRAHGHRQVRLRTLLAAGEPFAEIVRRGRGFDLIVTGRHGTRRFRDLLLGSTAERVTRRGHTPVLIVASPARGGYRRPLLAVDLSLPSRRAADTVARILPDQRRKLVAVHVYATAHDSMLRRVAGAAEVAAYLRSCRDEAQAAVDALLSRSHAAPCIGEILLRRGDPRATILRLARELGADLVAVGSHGRAPLVGELIGSVAEGVVRHASADILIVPPP